MLKLFFFIKKIIEKGCRPNNAQGLPTFRNAQRLTPAMLRDHGVIGEPNLDPLHVKLGLHTNPSTYFSSPGGCLLWIMTNTFIALISQEISFNFKLGNYKLVNFRILYQMRMKWCTAKIAFALHLAELGSVLNIPFSGRSTTRNNSWVSSLERPLSTVKYEKKVLY